MRNIDIIGKRNYFFALSFILILCGVVGYIVHGGFNLDIQFEGGCIMTIHMNDNKFDTAKVEETVTKAINKKVTAQKAEVPDLANKKTEYMLQLNVATTSQTLTVEEQNKILEVVGEDFGIKKGSQPEIRNVDPFIGKELRNNAFMAAFFAALLIVIYVGIRFRVMSGISAGVMGILALFHDALLMLSVYTVFDIPLNESFIAAVLTILGYSMNDTIIIYDRIRENSSLLRKMPIAELVNRSIVQTLNRSINTVLTVLISILTIFLFAYFNKIHSVTEFTFPLLIGVASGCYSSIFIASPLYVIWKEHKAKKAAAPKTAKA